jgi:hypothetical protein
MARDNSPKERQQKQLECKQGRRASYDRSGKAASTILSRSTFFYPGAGPAQQACAGRKSTTVGCWWRNSAMLLKMFLPWSGMDSVF